MFCTKCGNELPDNAVFCGQCGATVSGEEVKVEAVPVVETPVVEEPVVEEPVVEEPVVEEPVVEEPVVEEPVVEEPVVKAPVVEAPVVKTQPVKESVQPKQSFQPACKFPTERRMWKMILLGILTFGIYPIVIYIKMVDELNMAASRYDGKRTTNYYIANMLSSITLGIYGLWYMHTFSKRIGEELKRRGIDYKFGAGTYWGWNIFGSLIIVGPFIYLHKLTKAMNMINENYNQVG